jgi:predicted Fe-S protein YdhL (DUF1289 family)
MIDSKKTWTTLTQEEKDEILEQLAALMTKLERCVGHLKW